VSVSELQDPKKTSVSGHFRIWKDVYDTLEDEARIHEVSLNTFVNQLLGAYTRDELVYEKLGVLKLPKETYRMMLQLIPDDKLSEFGTELIKHWPTALMLARRGAINTEAVLDHLRDTSKMGFLSMYETERNGMKVVSLTHEFGQRYSIILTAAVKGLFELVNIRPKITATDSSVTVEY
jgi:hypothetical protein